MKTAKEVLTHFFNSNTFQKGASLAYYAVFSLLPMIVIIISIFGLFFGEAAVSGEIHQQLKSTLGSDAANQIQNIVKHHHTHHNSLVTTIAGFATLALSASGMFGQIHNSLNSIWNIQSKPRSSVLNYLSKHFFSFFVLIILFFTILISTWSNSFLVKYANDFSDNMHLYWIYEHVISFIVTSLGFACIFKFLGDATVKWKVAFLGGLFTALLFLFGKIVIGMYIGRNHLNTTFESASALAILMLWVYYTSQIIFLGASFVEVISKKMGCEILPNEDAVKIQKVELDKS